jgi:large subunit ribosomal protein L1
MGNTSVRMGLLRKATQGMSPVSLMDGLAKLCGIEDNVPEKRRIGFDQTVTIAVRTGVDTRQADQIVRGSVVLPQGTGKVRRVVVFAQGAAVGVATLAGADFVGAQDLAEKIKAGWLEFDVAVAAPDMMGIVGPLGRFLGPRGLMPSPKAGTVTADVGEAVRAYKGGKVEFRADSGGIVHCIIGKSSFGPSRLLENAVAVMKTVEALRPSALRGQYILGVTVQASMSPSMVINHSVRAWS